MSSARSKSKLLPKERLFPLENFGHSIETPAYLYRPTAVEQIEAFFDVAQHTDTRIGLRGAGRSYGDAALNSGQIVLDMRRMNRILDWNPDTGIITVEPGVTIEQLWRYVLEDGWWSPVMPGTMRPTLGGCLAANIHGKNNWAAGPIGEHVLSFEALLPTGKKVTCTPTKNKELFYGMVGSMGLLGVFTSITLQMKKIYSGDLEVTAWAVPNLKAVLTAADDYRDNDYIVGWVDSTFGGRNIGRGQMHRARYLQDGEDSDPQRTLQPDGQDLPANIFGLVPRSIVPTAMRVGMNNLGAYAGNWGKYFFSRWGSHQRTYRQSLVEFTFLLDYVPEWERAYGRNGLIQYQSFVPKETAEDVYREILQTSQRQRLPSYLGVLKRHRPDDFLLSYSVDGYSLALDFKVPRNKQRLQQLTSQMTRIVLEGGGKFYFAKDGVINAKDVTRFLGEQTVTKFKRLKGKVDPDCRMQTDLYRRCFG